MNRFHLTVTSQIGWAMWNIFLGGMLAGANLILYDGSPFYPSPQEHLQSILSLGYVALFRGLHQTLTLVGPLSSVGAHDTSQSSRS